jgi:hypothetical protein
MVQWKKLARPRCMCDRFRERFGHSIDHDTGHLSLA